MGIFKGIREGIIKTKTEQDAVCSEIDAFLSYVNAFFSDTTEYLGPDVSTNIREKSVYLADKITGVPRHFFVSRSKLAGRERNLYALSRDVEKKVAEHNNKVALYLAKTNRIGRMVAFNPPSQGEQNARDLSNMAAEVERVIELVEGKRLDIQQLQCIAKPVQNHLVIAGAGTGKTTTILGKVKYLIKSGKCAPQDILVLSFTNASAAEMRDRIANETKEDIEASTFHKLGLNIITAVSGVTPKITKIVLQRFVKEQLMEKMRDPQYLWLLCNYFIRNYKYEKAEFDFQSREEYEEYLRMNPPVTLKGDRVKSYGEMDIANFLYQNGISYEYEKEYEVDTRTADKAQYYPDFYLTDYGIYIEYYGINEKGEVPGYFVSRTGKSPSEEYREGIEWKRNTHRENGTRLIEGFSYERSRGDLLQALETKLKDAGVMFRPISTEDLWNKVAEDNSKNVLSTLADLMATIISLIKSNYYSLEQVRSFGAFPIVDLLAPIYETYDMELKRRGEIDFNDMINDAVRVIQEGKYVNQYKIVIVDEYQDMSKSRYTLLKALRESSYFDLFCVGDDWQSIYRFTGSDMAYILNFPAYWGPTEYSMIETTYRFTDSLIEISSGFVMENPSQIRKAIRGIPSRIGFAMGEVKGYTEELAIRFMLDRLQELPENSTVFFIGRYNFDGNLLSDCKELECRYDNETKKATVVYPNRRDLKMEFITAHKSKGLQADYVFVINNKDRGMGFPSKIQDDPLVDKLLEGKESFPFAEERRLFYVALTRARVKAYLLVVKGNESGFASEMEHKYGDRLKDEWFTCPRCGGHLVKREGQYGEFYGCSNYRRTNCTFTRKIKAHTVERGA